MEISSTLSNNKATSRDGATLQEDCGSGPLVRPPWCRQRVQLFNDEPSMTQASHFDQTDVNAIVRRFERTGVLPEARGTPQYGDVTALQGDLTELMARSTQQIERARAFASSWQPPPEPENIAPVTETPPPA